MERTMPTYTYECEKCSNIFEIEQKITDPPRKRCPECRGKVFRVIHPVGHILRGSGFYRTDYRGDDYSKSKLAEERPASGPSSCEGCGKKDSCGT
jgi:putative FmdB family regulatory protein